MAGILMGKQTEYLKGKEELKGRIFKYLKKRKDSISEMMGKHFKETGEINCCQLEVLFTYNAIISDVKYDRLD